MKKRLSAIFPLLFITLICVLAVEGFYRAVEWFLFTPVGKTAIAASAPKQQQVAVNSVKRTTEGRIKIILDRKIFGAPPSDSKNLAAENTSPTDLQAIPLSLVLMGTIVGDGEESRAIILEKDNKSQDIYQLGEIVQGAVLKEIQRGKVVLTYNNRDQILDMSEAAKYSARIPPPAPAPAPTAMAPEIPNEPSPPGSAPQDIGEPQPSLDPALPGTQNKVVRPVRRTYTPTPEQPSP